VNAPHTLEGRMIWSLALDLGGQFRFVVLPRRLMRTGYDMTAALALAAARGVTAATVAEFLPIIEQAAVRGSARTED